MTDGKAAGPGGTDAIGPLLANEESSLAQMPWKVDAECM